MTRTNHVAIKGTRDGLVLYLDPEVDLPVLLDELGNLLSDSGQFLKGADVRCFSGGKVFLSEENERLKALLEEHHLGFAGWLEEKDVYVPGKPPLGYEEDKGAQIRDEGMEETNCLFIEKTLRSGQSICYQGHVIVYGDLNPGAEIIASGNIFVLGALRGVAHAGAEGDRDASVSAYYLAPTQLRIADLVTRPPEDENGWRGPEVARIREDKLVVEALVINMGRSKTR